MRNLVTAEGTRTAIRKETEKAFGAIKGSLIDALKSGNSVTRELLANPPGKAPAIAAMEEAVNEYLVPLAQQICLRYGIDSSRFEISLQLPQLLANDLVNRMMGAGSRLIDTPSYHVQYAARIVGKKLVEAKMDGAGPVALFYLAVVGTSEGMSWYGRRKAIAAFRQAALQPDAVEQITASILSKIGLIIEERASVVERFVK